jgi:hypothetical protein
MGFNSAFKGLNIYEPQHPGNFWACPGSKPDGDEIFRPSRPALGPTQPSVK